MNDERSTRQDDTEPSPEPASEETAADETAPAADEAGPELVETLPEPDDDAGPPDMAAVAAALDEALGPDDESVDMDALAASLDETLDPDAMDVDAALAAVATLAELGEADEDEETEAVDDETGQLVQISPPSLSYMLARPPLMSLERGQAASVVPALLLMAAGAGLTLLLTTSGTRLELPLLAGMAAGITGLALLAQWRSSQGWGRGSFFIGLLLLLWAGVLAFLVSPQSPGPAGWPLLVSALGAALLLTGLLTRPAIPRLALAGLALLLAGLAGLPLTTGLLGPDIIQTLAALWPLAAVLVLALLLLPLLIRHGE